MEYLGQIVNGVVTLIFSIVAWQVKRHLNSISEREAELQSALAEKEAELYAMMAEERKRIEEMRVANNKGTQALLLDRLQQGYHFFMKRGVVTYGEARSMENMYKAYHSLGKNGVMDGMYQKFKTIPIKTDAEVYPDEPHEIL